MARDLIDRLVVGGERPAPPAPPPGSVFVVRAAGVAPLSLPRVLLRAPRPRRIGTAPARTSLATWARRHLGARALVAWVAPQVRAAFGAWPNALGAADAWPLLLARHARRGVRGLADLPPPGVGPPDPDEGVPPRDLSGEAVPVARVRALVLGEGPPAVRLEEGTLLAARRIVLAVDRETQARLLEPHDAPAADDLAALPRTDRARVTLELEGPAARRLGARAPFRLVVAPGANVRAHRMDGEARDEGVRVEAVLGGPLDPSVLDLEDDVLVRACEADLLRGLGLSEPPATATVVREEGAWIQPVPGLAARLLAHRVRLAARGLVLVGGHLAPGGEAPPSVRLPAGCRLR